MLRKVTFLCESAVVQTRMYKYKYVWGVYFYDIYIQSQSKFDIPPVLSLFRGLSVQPSVQLSLCLVGQQELSLSRQGTGSCTVSVQPSSPASPEILLTQSLDIQVFSALSYWDAIHPHLQTLVGKPDVLAKACGRKGKVFGNKSPLFEQIELILLGK